MTATVFIDTNILLYSIDEDPAALMKRQRAQQILLTESWGWSVQVAAEFYVNATSSKRPFRLKPVDATALVETWLASPTVSLTPPLLRMAIEFQQRFQLSYWDAAIIAAAKQMGCPTVFSEDLSGGQTFEGVTVVNPFAGLTTA
jgi:predicted nucleic acid-binding protein